MTTESAILSNPKWQTNQIFSNAGREYKFTWLFAFIWNAMTWFAIIAGGENILEAFEESPVFYFFVMFPFIGLYMIYMAMKQTLAWRRFGKTPMTLDPFPGQLGGAVGGYVDMPVPYDATHQVKVSLSCMHEYWDKRGGKHEKRREAIWQDSLIVNTTTSAMGSKIRFDFQPPADLPQSQPDGKEKYEWEIHMHLPLSDHDFDRQFVIPVINTCHQMMSTATRYASDKVDLIRPSDSTVDTSIPLISPSVGCTRFHYPLFRNKGMGMGLMIGSFITAVFLWFMYQEATDFFPTFSKIFFGFGGVIVFLLFLLGIYLISNSLTVDVGPAGVTVKHKILGFSFGGDIPATTIADIITKKTASSSDGRVSRVWYSLKLIQKDGSETIVGDTLEGSSYAQGMRHKMIDCLGSGWSPSDYSQIPKKSEKYKNSRLGKVIGRMISLVILGVILYDFRDFFFKLLNMLGSSL